MLDAFLLAFPALFSIVSPITGAFIFREATAERSHGERVRLAWRVAFYSLIVMVVAGGAGSYVLAVLGISLAALRIAGGLVLTLFAWELLGEPEKREGRKAAEAQQAESAEDVAFFPLTLPFTTGPGTISVAVALGAGHPSVQGGSAQAAFFAGLALAAVAMAGVIGVFYSYADRLADVLGRTGNRTVTRLSAFLLFCIGIQVLITGATSVLEPLLTR